MFVYHRKPKNFFGDTIFPLNQMSKTHPEIYAAQAKKYLGREELMNRRIPILNCLWNDVIHLAPIHPKHVFSNLRRAGAATRPSVWFRFPITALAEKEALCFTPMVRSPLLDPAKFQSLYIESYEELTELPAATKDHYRESVLKNEKTLMFIGCPHILVMSSLPVRLADEIHVE